jgi:hypothetical protein
MPTISLLDGFSEVQEAYELRINVFTPISGIAEIYHFGGWYIIVFVTTVWWWLVAATRYVQRNSGFGAAAVVALSSLVVVLMHQYSTRTSWRFLLLMLIFCSFEKFRASGFGKGYLPANRVATRSQLLMKKRPDLS